MSVITLKNINKSFGSFNAVSGFDLETEDGEFVVLVGPSGCGKTTTMRMIAGLEDASSGQMLIDGVDVLDQSPSERDVAMVFQNYALYPHLIVYDNLAVCLKVRGWTRDRIDAQVRKTAGVMGIAPLLYRKPASLSVGQRQRVALGRAIVRQPRVFLMDEPLSNLDAKLRIEMRAEIVKLCRRLKIATFYVTHDQLEALAMGHRIVVMCDGKAQQIGTPPMNFLDATDGQDGRMTDKGFALEPAGAIGVAVRQHGGRVIAGIRPEHLFPDHAGRDGEGEFTGQMEIIETLGWQVMIQFRLGDTSLTAQIERRPDLRLGDRLTLRHQPGIVHAFDRATERSLIESAGNSVRAAGEAE